MSVQASVNAGLVSILVVNHKWRMERTTDLVITLPNSVSGGANVTYYLIDAAHSNRYDVGSGTGVLQTVTAPTITAGTVTITMEPRSVHLLQFGPQLMDGQWGIPR